MADLGINVIFEGRNLVRILEGLGVTVGISALSVVLSLVLGVFVGLGMRSRWRPLRWLMQLYLEFVRIMPQLVLLFVAYFGLTRVAGINLNGITASVLVFTMRVMRLTAGGARARRVCGRMTRRMVCFGVSPRA